MTESTNTLEQALARAADDPASRPEFYRLMLESEIFVIGHSDASGEGRSTVPAGAKLSIVNWEKQDGTRVIPFFTSIEALQRALKEEARYVAMPARSFFELTCGSFLALNPASNYGKEFHPDEINAILKTGVNHAVTPRIVQKARKVLVGQPVNYPTEMVSALTSLLAKHPNVKAAYLSLMHDPESQVAPTLLVGLEGDGDMSAAIRDAGSVAADTAPRGEPVDFMELKRSEPGVNANLFESVTPFYQRKWGSKLRSLFHSART